ncbi:MAG: regulatory protein RecX [Chitinophagaceae bacterium]
MNNMEEKPQRRTYGREQLLQKLKEFCAYQERCHQEVRDKAFALGISNVDLGELLATLIEENYLNEERFAIMYAGGKFRMKHWGRVKIKYALKQKGVSEYSIKKALKQIDMDDYDVVLRKVAEKKEALITGSTVVKKKKLYQFLLSRGFESDLIRAVL